MASVRRKNDFVRSARKKAGSDGAEATGTALIHSFSAEMRDADADANTVPRALCPVPLHHAGGGRARARVDAADVAPAAPLAGAEADAVRAPTHPPCPVAVPMPPCG